MASVTTGPALPLVSQSSFSHGDFSDSTQHLLKMFMKKILVFLFKKLHFENSQQLLKFTITGSAVLTNYHSRWGSETPRLMSAQLRSAF